MHPCCDDQLPDPLLQSSGDTSNDQFPSPGQVHRALYTPASAVMQTAHDVFNPRKQELEKDSTVAVRQPLKQHAGGQPVNTNPQNINGLLCWRGEKQSRTAAG